MSLNISLVDGLLSSPDGFLGFADATGGAVLYDGGVRTAGATPPPQELPRLVEWLATSGASDVFATDFLPRRQDRRERLGLPFAPGRKVLRIVRDEQAVGWAPVGSP